MFQKHNQFVITYCPNVSTTPLQQCGIRQCLPFSWTTLRGKHYWHPIAVKDLYKMHQWEGKIWIIIFFSINASKIIMKIKWIAKLFFHKITYSIFLKSDHFDKGWLLQYLIILTPKLLWKVSVLSWIEFRQQHEGFIHTNHFGIFSSPWMGSKMCFG